MSDVSVRGLLHFIFDAGSVIFTQNLQDRIISIENLRQFNQTKPRLRYNEVDSIVLSSHNTYHFGNCI